MRLRTKVIALAVLAVFLASVGAANVASAQDENNASSYDTTLMIGAIKQVTKPGESISVVGHLGSGTYVITNKAPNGAIVKVYQQRRGLTSVFGREIGRASTPVLVATATTTSTGVWYASLTFKQPGDYYVYATFDGATDAGSDYRPSQSGMMAVKVTNMPERMLRQPTDARLSCDEQVAFAGESGQLTGFINSGFEWVYTGRTSLYCQFKAPGSDVWGAPALVSTSKNPPAPSWTYTFTQSGYYRFQMKYAGDPVWKMGGYDASTSNYVDVLVTTPIIVPPD
jgi:hypothetical protein